MRMTIKTCLQTQANGKTCGRKAVARTAAGPVCGIHARSEERRGGEVTPFPTPATYVQPGRIVLVKPRGKHVINHIVLVKPSDKHVDAEEWDNGQGVAFRRFTGETAYKDAKRWADFIVNPVPENEDPRPRDKSGYLYITAHGMDWRVTECCEAPTTYTGDGTHICKACYRSVDEAYGDLPVIGNAEPNPVGRIVVSLTEGEKVIWKNECHGSESYGPMVIARTGEAYSLGNQPWVNRKHAVAEAERLGLPFVEA